MSPDPHPTATVFGHRMVLHPFARDRYVSTSLAQNGCFEPFQTELVVNEVRPGDVALDVGAHIGYYTLLLARLVGPRGKVVAFEPDPDSFALLRHNVALNRITNVELINAAAGTRAGRARLYRSGDNAGDHRLHAAAEDRPSVEVEVVAVDDVVRGRVDFVKADVQGAEGTALEGMAGVIGQSPRAKMMVEFWPLGLGRAGYGAGRLLDRLGALEFRVYEIDEAAWTVRRAIPKNLLDRFPPATDTFTNLLCVKAPLGGPVESTMADPTATALLGELRRGNDLAAADYLARLLAGERYADPLRLPRSGFQVFSSHHEDGLIAEVFRRIGTTGRRFVEVGVNPLECNTLFLLAGGWSGVWVDASARDLRPVAQYTAEGRLACVRAAVIRENVDDVLRTGGVVGEIDLLSLGLDRNNYWVWEGLVAVRPRVVVIGYDAAFPPPLSVAPAYQSGAGWDGASDQGASLEALTRLAARKGYALVGCGVSGATAVFVRSDLVGEGRFRDPFTAANHYEEPRPWLRLRATRQPRSGPLVHID